MPKVVQYELAISYIINETLTEDQKDNVLGTITLQTDPRYYQYWILIGRGQAEEALIVSRQLEDLDLIMLALLHHEEEVKQDNDLKEQERRDKLNDIDVEKKVYQQQIEELQKLVEEAEIKEPLSQNEQQETNDTSQNIPVAPENTNESAIEEPTNQGQ